MKETVTVRFPENLQKELELIAKEEKKSKSEIIREAEEAISKCI